MGEPVAVSWHELEREDSQVHTIALYKRERAVHPGCLIAVNANYTCYAIRGGPRRTCATLSESRARTPPPTLQVAWSA